MSEVLFPPPSFESFLYDEAVRFRLAIDDLDADTIEEAEESLREILREINNGCNYLGVSLSVRSANHSLDWSYGESGGVSMQHVIGTLRGELIGFAMMPFVAEISGQMEPSLAVIMKSTIYEDDLDHHLPVLIVTPISGSEISQLTE